MRVKFNVTLVSDDGKVSRGATSELALATNINGVDPSAAMQDFLQQAEGLVRSIVDNQIPALYQSVTTAESKGEGGDADDGGAAGSAAAAVHAKLDKLRAKKAEELETCTRCGVSVPHDDAHFIQVVRDGKLAPANEVLCEQCFTREMANNKEDKQ